MRSGIGGVGCSIQQLDPWGEAGIKRYHAHLFRCRCVANGKVEIEHAQED